MEMGMGGPMSSLAWPGQLSLPSSMEELSWLRAAKLPSCLAVCLILLSSSAISWRGLGSGLSPLWPTWSCLATNLMTYLTPLGRGNTKTLYVFWATKSPPRIRQDHTARKSSLISPVEGYTSVGFKQDSADYQSRQ